LETNSVDQPKAARGSDNDLYSKIQVPFAIDRDVVLAAKRRFSGAKANFSTYVETLIEIDTDDASKPLTITLTKT
jgi:hypothetical protein